MLNISQDQITRIEISNPMQYTAIIDTKLTILDLKVHLNDNSFILVEMQVRKFKHWTNRTVVYTCKQLTEQVHENFDYDKLQPVILISIMDYTLFPDHKRFFKKYKVVDDENYPYTDKIQFWVMDLTQIAGATDEQKAQGLVEWARAFSANSWEEFNQIQNSAIKEAAKTMELIMSNPTDREKLRMRQDAQNDWITMLNSERRDGIEIGRKDGIEIGRKDGMDIGRIQTLAELVEDGILTIEAAAQRANMTVQAFTKEAKGIKK